MCRFSRELDLPLGSSLWELRFGHHVTEAKIVRKALPARADILGGWRVFARQAGFQPNDELRVEWTGGKTLVLTNLGQTGKPSVSRNTPTRPTARPCTPNTPASAGPSGGVQNKKKGGGAGSSKTPGKVKKAPAKKTPSAKPAAARPRSKARRAEVVPQPEGAPEQQQQAQQQEEGPTSGWCIIC
eukprot:scaffold1.g5206.t1